MSGKAEDPDKADMRIVQASAQEVNIIVLSSSVK